MHPVIFIATILLLISISCSEEF